MAKISIEKAKEDICKDCKCKTCQDDCCGACDVCDNGDYKHYTCKDYMHPQE